MNAPHLPLPGDARIERLAIVGVGLIGGSLAAALREAGRVDTVVGIGRSQATLDEAIRLGLIDHGFTDAATGVRGADMVVLAMPVGQTGRMLATIAPGVGPRTIVTDAGSTKSDVVAAAREHFAAHMRQFVPAHPIAGDEKSGPSAARANLYRGRNVVTTPLAETDAAAVARVEAMWRSAGAVIHRMTPQQHDDVFATVSHLPHLLAYALVAQVALDPDHERLFSYAASGFRDFTRIAGSHPEMWRDIALANREALLNRLDGYTAQVAQLRAALVTGDGAALERTFALAKDARAEWLRRTGQG
ncbi:MAG: prephenate dehydrogenase/arogenate dehydrogenase family protein [Rhodocyclaceae bacterium]|nr:prephenate dehydrogenase/arogenate dehydrogenase family protein [Rhodocyclaceae bacterium]